MPYKKKKQSPSSAISSKQQAETTMTSSVTSSGFSGEHFLTDALFFANHFISEALTKSSLLRPAPNVIQSNGNLSNRGMLTDTTVASQTTSTAKSTYHQPTSEGTSAQVNGMCTGSSRNGDYHNPLSKDGSLQVNGDYDYDIMRILSSDRVTPKK